MATTPTIAKPEWYPTDPATMIAPSGAKSLQGWLPFEPLPAQNFNWLLNSISTWLDYLDELTGELDTRISTLMYAGFIIPYAGGTVQDGWDFADGGELLIANYPDLYANIGTTYDLGKKADGTYWTAPTAGYFRKPDYRGAFLRGVGTSMNIAGGGSVAVTLGGFVDDTAKAHTHTIDHGHSISDPAHYHNYTRKIDTQKSGPSGSNAAPATNGTYSTDYAYTGISVVGHSGSSGSNGGTETAPRHLGANFLIRLFNA